MIEKRNLCCMAAACEDPTCIHKDPHHKHGAECTVNCIPVNKLGIPRIPTSRCRECGDEHAIRRFLASWSPDDIEVSVETPAPHWDRGSAERYLHLGDGLGDGPAGDPLAALAWDKRVELQDAPPPDAAILERLDPVHVLLKRPPMTEIFPPVCADKPRLGVLLRFSRALERLGTVLDYGERKHGGPRAGKAERGPQAILDALMRHLVAMQTETLDPESGRPHSWHVLANAFMLVDQEEDPIK